MLIKEWLSQLFYPHRAKSTTLLGRVMYYVLLCIVVGSLNLEIGDLGTKKV